MWGGGLLQSFGCPLEGAPHKSALVVTLVCDCKPRECHRVGAEQGCGGMEGKKGWHQGRMLRQIGQVGQCAAAAAKEEVETRGWIEVM